METRFLDICSPETLTSNALHPVAFWQDRQEVGELTGTRNMDVRIRGIVQPMRRAPHPSEPPASVSVAARRVPAQFAAGAGFNAEQERPPVSDPNLRSQGGKRAFMSTASRNRSPGE